MGNVLTIRQAVSRAREDGLPVSEYTLRAWIKTGVIPVIPVTRKGNNANGCYIPLPPS